MRESRKETRVAVVLCTVRTRVLIEGRHRARVAGEGYASRDTARAHMRLGGS